MKRKLKESGEIFDRRPNEYANDDAKDTDQNAVPNVYSGDRRRLFQVESSHFFTRLKSFGQMRKKFGRTGQIKAVAHFGVQPL